MISYGSTAWDVAIQNFLAEAWWDDETFQRLATIPLILPLYALATVFHLLPYDWAPTRPFYACDSRGVPLQYTLNGLTVAICVCSIFILAPPEVQQSFYHNYWANLMRANAFGLAVSLFFLLRGGREKYTRCITVDQVPLTGATLGTLTLAPTTPPPLLVRFFLGCEWNPRIVGVDVKMWLYLLGAVGLGANVLSFAATQHEYAGGRSSLAMTVYTRCFMWFLVDYLFNEDVHLYTYDIFAEKIGFKLAWGCLVFYPFFYGIGAFPLVRAATDISPAEAAAAYGLFLVGWALTRGANLQKFYKRKNPESTHCFLGLVRQETVPGTRILVSGWWGWARHVNYLGEILQAVALSVPGVVVGHGVGRWVPLLYPLYYVLLFVPRQFDDDALCKGKYGAQWDEYVRRVPYRIVPFVW